MVLVIGLNPAIDRILIVPNFAVGATLKAESVQTLAAGKAMNVAAVLRLLGVRVGYAGFVGREEAAFFRRRLPDVECWMVEVDGRTRTDTTLIDPLGHTETHVREPGFAVRSEDIERFLDAFTGVIGGAELVVMSGSLPPGAPEGLYAELVGLCHARHIRTLLDTSGTPLAMGAAARPSFLKPNTEELGELTGGNAGSEAEVVLLAKTLLQGNTQAVAVTRGAEGAVLVDRETAIQGNASVPSVVNTVGCGDAFVAGWVAKLVSGSPLTEQLGEALAVAGANAMTHGAGVIERRNLDLMRDRVTISDVW
ncbi:MAG TPA: 1-phosphofructokinase family hexose kinase [Candidatus Latescibacteria bacterium]|nr:1-phosphofructokinase family hexose kinase [Candidatus Latescibacterota bacterium]